MIRLPLFPKAPQAEVGWEEPEPLDAACVRCELHEKVRSVCMRPEGKPGGLYVIADAPLTTDDNTGRPFTGGGGKYLRSLIAKWWSGPVAFDHAARCAPYSRKMKEKHVDACRPYTAKIIREVRPTRIIALGGWAAYALLARKPQVHAIRRGHGWWIDEEMYPDPASFVPIYFAVSPTMSLRNRFIAKQFEDDLRWALTEPVPEPRHTSGVTWDVRTVKDADEARATLRGAVHVTFDTETSGVPHDDDFRVECATFYPAGAKDGYTWDRPAIEDEGTRSVLRSLLVDPEMKFTGHNLKYDAKAVMCDSFLRCDITSGMHADTRLFRKLLDGDVVAKLEVAAEVVGMGGHKEEADVIVEQVKTDLARLAAEPSQPPLKSGKPRKPYVPKIVARENVPEETLEKLRSGRAEPINFAYRFVPTDVRTRYNARDALATSLLMEDLEPRVLAQPNLVRVWEKVMKPAMRVLTRIEARGVLADRMAIDLFDQHLTSLIDPIHARLKAYGDINYDSPKQLGELLYGKLGLPVVGTTKTGQPSVDKDALEELSTRHPIAKDLIEYSHLTTIRGTYARGLRSRVHDDSRLHTTFLLDGAGTGRMSSQDPNLQNIPSPDRDPVLGKMARDCFVAAPGYRLVEWDYSQLELRVAAMISQDPVMIAMFQSGHDFHEATAKMVAPVAWKVTDWDALDAATRKKYRAQAKNMNFQINYDLEPAYKLAMTLGCSVGEAERFVALVMGKFAKLQRTIANAVAAAKKHGCTPVYIDGEIANVRPLPALGESETKESRGRIRNAMNAAWNTVVQGTAAHFATRSLEPLQRAFDEEGLDAHVVLTVHDSIMAEVREDQVDEVMAIGCQVMSSWPSAGVPLVVDVKTGSAWGSLAKAA